MLTHFILHLQNYGLMERTIYFSSGEPHGPYAPLCRSSKLHYLTAEKEATPGLGSRETGLAIGFGGDWRDDKRTDEDQRRWSCPARLAGEQGHRIRFNGQHVSSVPLRSPVAIGHTQGVKSLDARTRRALSLSSQRSGQNKCKIDSKKH